MISNNSSREGSILIVVLLVVAGAGVLLASLSKKVLIDHISAQTLNSAYSSGSMIEGVENAAIYALQENLAEANPDTMHEDWAYFSEDAQTINEALKSSDINAQITDENSLFPINRLTYKEKNDKALFDLYSALFLRMTLNLLDAHEIGQDDFERGVLAKSFLTSIQSWCGAPLKTHPDDTWYSEQEPKYRRANRKMLYPKN